MTDFPVGWSNKQLAFDALETTLGKQSHPNPAHNNHTRINLDQSAIILEAEFTNEEIARDNIIQKVANALGLTFGQVDATLNIQHMGGEGSAWPQSHAAMLAFLSANMADWEAPAS